MLTNVTVITAAFGFFKTRENISYFSWGLEKLETIYDDPKEHNNSAIITCFEILF